MNKQETELNKNEVIFKIYTLGPNKENVFLKDYIFTLNLTLGDIRSSIADDITTGENNYINLENITERIYKDFGKLFFDKGVLPITLDNYKLEQFTNGLRTFSFLATVGVLLPKNIINKKPKTISNENSTLKRLIKEDRELKNKEDGFVFYNDDFPPLS